MIIVTGGSGKAGRACVKRLVAEGFEVLNIDLVPPPEDLGCLFVKADLTDYGQAISALSHIDERIGKPADGVVHLAAIPAPGLSTNDQTYRVNMLSTWNVFESCRALGINNVVWASSETVLGLPFDVPPPYVPIDENVTRPETTYSLTKALGETMAEHFCRWNPQMKIVGLRLSNVMELHDYANFESWQSDPRARKWNLWGYIDARDAAEAMLLALKADLTGAEVFVIANSDTTMRRANGELLDEVFPGVERRDVTEDGTLLSIEKARRVLGYEPKHNWK